MPVKELHISGYRSVKELRLKLKRINVLVGPNGCGKSNLYRSMMLIASAARGRLAHEIALDGGIASILWAGPRLKNDKKNVFLEVTLKELTYSLEFGRVPFSERFLDELQPFVNDPDIKREEVKFQAGPKSVTLVKRSKGLLMARNMDGRPIEYPLAVQGNESVLSGLREPQKFPELSALREEFLNWRFYHQFRTDIDSPLRQPQIGVMTPVLSDDGIDLAAALATIQAIGDRNALTESIDDAFPGSHLNTNAGYGLFSLSLTMPGFERAFESLELSDGTLQYLCLLTALLSPRPPALLALNEPETSIHPDLYEALAKLIVRASKKSQIWITTHSRDLAAFIAKYGGNEPIELEKRRGRTLVRGEGLIESEAGDADEVLDADELLYDRDDFQDDSDPEKLRVAGDEEIDDDDDY